MEEPTKKQFTMNLNSIFLLIGLIAFIFTAGVNYGALTSLKDDIKDIKVDYARKDVLEIRLSSIDQTLIDIKADVKVIRER